MSDSIANQGKSKKASKRSPAKYIKAPGAPRRFKTAFIFFSTEKHKEIRMGLDEKGKKEKSTNVAKMVSEAWKTLSSQDREYWDEKARLDKERYEMEKSLYDGPWKIAAQKLSENPNLPKRPMSAFFAYSKIMRSEVKQKNPSLSNTELSKLLAMMWKDEDQEEKQKYVDEELQLREEYKRRISEWRVKEDFDKGFERETREEIALRTLQSQKQQELSDGVVNSALRLHEIASSQIPHFQCNHSFMPIDNNDRDCLLSGKIEPCSVMANANESINQGPHPSLRNSDTHQQQSFELQFDPRLIAAYDNGHVAYRFPSYNGQNNSIFSRYDQSETSVWNSHETIPNNQNPSIFTPLQTPDNALRYQIFNKNLPLNNPENENGEGGSESSSILDMSNSS